MLTPENVVAIPLPDFEGGFGFTPWENSAQMSPPPAHPAMPQPLSPSPARTQAQFQLAAATPPRSSGSDEPDRGRAEERRLRRMISNRESARRSRVRKQRHLEDLRGQVDRLKSENRELADRLVAVTRHCLFFCRHNYRLRSEAAALRRRLDDVRRVLIFRHLQRLATTPPPPPPPPPPGGPQSLVVPPVYGGGFMTETELIA